MNTPNISAYLQFWFYEWVYYLDPDERFPSTKYKPTQWLGLAHNVGNTMTFQLLTKDMNRVIKCSAIMWAQDDTDKTMHWDPNLDWQTHNETHDLLFPRQCNDPNSMTPQRTWSTSKKQLR